MRKILELALFHSDMYFFVSFHSWVRERQKYCVFFVSTFATLRLLEESTRTVQQSIDAVHLLPLRVADIRVSGKSLQLNEKHTRIYGCR
jgi:hypothetical protein